MKHTLILLFALLPLPALQAKPIANVAHPEISGIYPHLTMFNDEGECGTGGVVPWGGKLWIITYGPHLPKGSSDKLYEVPPDLTQTIRQESIGGTPANRMVHAESGQLFLGPYAIKENGSVRAIPYSTMFGRHTGLARHLTDPAGKIVFATMEEGIYEVDVQALTPTTLWADEQVKEGRHSDLPGYHGKGFYSAQGRYVYANNGDHAREALKNPAVPSGVLAEWDGKADQWTVVRRNQFTEVTGPGGIHGSKPEDPIWAVGWDHKSLILMLLDGGKWESFRLPKSSHSYDGAHGWNTEWPRIREIGKGDELLMTMHGAFWKFPKGFRKGNTAGIRPRSNYLKVIGDFCHWQDKLVFGCDDTAKSEFLNLHPLKGELAGPGQSQSNLWFSSDAEVDQLGPVIGRGAVWLNEDVAEGATSDPFLVAGYSEGSLLLSVAEGTCQLALEVDKDGKGTWQPWKTVTVTAGKVDRLALDVPAEWLRVKAIAGGKGVTAIFHGRQPDKRGQQNAPVFAGVSTAATEKAGSGSRGVLLARGNKLKTLRLVPDGQSAVAYDLNAKLELTKVDDSAGASWTATKAGLPDLTKFLKIEDDTVVYTDSEGKRWRLPKGQHSGTGRVCREICTERNLLNLYGTFYEMPAQNAGGFHKIRAVATHNLAIADYTSYHGLLVMSGIDADASGKHIIRSSDGQAAVWAGNVEDLWKLGKPRGQVTLHRQAKVLGNTPSDAALLTGFDSVKLHLTCAQPAKVQVEVDTTGYGNWAAVESLSCEPGKALAHQLPPSGIGYWLRLVFAEDAEVTEAGLSYE